MADDETAQGNSSTADVVAFIRARLDEDDAARAETRFDRGKAPSTTRVTFDAVMSDAEHVRGLALRRIATRWSWHEDYREDWDVT